MAKQKIVINVSMNDEKSRVKAMQIAVGACGVDSATLKGDGKTQLEVTGDGLDAVVLTRKLRKKVGYADLVTVGPAGGGGEKKKEEQKPKENEASWPIHYYSVVPSSTYTVVRDPYCYEQNNCSIM